MAKISGIVSSNKARIMVIKETDWTVESNSTSSVGAFEISGLTPGKKLIISRAITGECLGFGNITAIEEI
jgi:hypothetical protein